MDSSSIFWLLPLSRVILSFICDGFVSRWLPFVAEHISIMRVDHDLFIRSPFGGPLGCFQHLALTKVATVNVHVVTSVWTHAIVSFG